MTDDPTGADPGPTEPADPAAAHVELVGAASEPPPAPRPLIERIGLAVVALVLAVMFGGVSAASWAGGEPFLAVMGGIGCLMTIWVGVLTLLRG